MPPILSMIILVIIVILFFLPGELYMRLDKLRTSADIRLKRMCGSMTEYMDALAPLTEMPAAAGIKSEFANLRREFDANKSYKKRFNRIVTMHRIHDLAETIPALIPDIPERRAVGEKLNALNAAMEEDRDDFNARAEGFNIMRVKRLYSLFKMPAIPELHDLGVSWGE